MDGTRRHDPRRRPARRVRRPPPSEEEILRRAQAIHDRAITMDTHVDINPANFTPERSYATRLPTQVDLVKMEEGGSTPLS